MDRSLTPLHRKGRALRGSVRAPPLGCATRILELVPLAHPGGLRPPTHSTGASVCRGCQFGLGPGAGPR
eukprot:30818-Alexandrium_andersonii.AAC.1